MATKLSYEPSIQAVLRSTLPAASKVIGDSEALRARVSWPIRLRAGGLGRIQGGEIVLVPAARYDEVLERLPELRLAGVAGVVLPLSRADNAVECNSAPVVAFAGESVDFQALQEQMQAFIMERRRELYALEQDLHRELVEGAIAGLPIGELLKIAAERAGRSVALDRDGEVEYEGEDGAAPDHSLLVQSRLACQANQNGSIQLVGSPSSLAMAVFTGKERRGIAILVGADVDVLDEQEAVLSSLASACAIAMGREPAARVPSLSEVLERQHHSALSGDMPSETWTAIALAHSAVPVSALQKGVTAELSARQIPFLLGNDNSDLVVLVQGRGETPWEGIVATLQDRAGVPGLRAGLSPESAGSDAPQASKAALEALRLGTGSITRYEDVQLQVMLKDLPGGDQFVQGTLGPLLGSEPRSKELLDTLKVFVETGRNAVRASTQLNVHRNTLLYRLRAIQEMLKMNFDRDGDLFRIDLALRILAARRRGGKE